MYENEKKVIYKATWRNEFFLHNLSISSNLVYYVIKYDIQ